MGAVGGFDKRHRVINEVQTVDRDLLVVLPVVRRRDIGNEISRIRDAHSKKPNKNSSSLNLNLRKNAIDAVYDALLWRYPLFYFPPMSIQCDNPPSELSERRPNC